MRFVQLLGVLWGLFATACFSYAARAAEDDPAFVLALGDSLTAGYELPPEDAFPVRLEAALRAEGLDVTVINAGVSGDTSSGGLARLEWALSDVPDGKPDLAIVELGANDALRGIDPKITWDNLGTIIEELQEQGVRVLLAGMKAPPNMGEAYAAEFDAIYPALAEAYGVALYPFFLDGVAANPALQLADGMHPNRQGVDAIVTGIAPLVKTLLMTTPEH